MMGDDWTGTETMTDRRMFICGINQQNLLNTPFMRMIVLYHS